MDGGTRYCEKKVIRVDAHEWLVFSGTGYELAGANRCDRHSSDIAECGTAFGLKVTQHHVTCSSSGAGALLRDCSCTLIFERTGENLAPRCLW